MSRCEQVHPERRFRCELPPTNHPTCTGYDEQLGDYQDWSNLAYHPPQPKLNVGQTKTKLAAMAAQVRPEPTTGFPAALAGSERAAERWTERQRALVDAAIHAVATRHRRGGEFTTDDIWAELAGSVPVTKGITGRLIAAKHAGILDSTGKRTVSKRGGDHDHAQTLLIWYSLVD